MSDEYALRAARILLQLGAVAINTEEPFTYASGIQSPIYTDNRLLISHPVERGQITSMFEQVFRSHYGSQRIEVVAGTATSGIPFAAWLSDRLELPMVYVRGAAKTHGLTRQVEGRLSPGQKVVVVEDLITSGGSALNTVDALRAAGADVAGCLAIFSYGFKRAAAAFAERNVELLPLTSLPVLLAEAVRAGYISEAGKEIVESWAAVQQA